ncbi:MAG TPA: hypothetical protein VN752_05580 [Solirubrobacterales bacterium]|nr:hypothetical protein [Solirubrobacterales bacterium]
MDEQGTIYALVVVLEADSREEAFDRISEEIAPEPANAHFVGEPFKIDRDDEYDSESVAGQILGAVKRERQSQQLTAQALNPEPAYTVIGRYRDNDQTYIVTVYTYNGTKAAAKLAREACSEESEIPLDELDLDIVAIFEGEPAVVARRDEQAL